MFEITGHNISKNIKNLDSAVILAGWAALLLATIWAYWPGLHGPFVLDDFGSIAALGDHGGIKDWATFKAFVFGGHSGPTGRPLSLLTFLVDATNWPADSFSFKRTNLVIHLLNGVLLGILISKVLSKVICQRLEGRDFIGWVIRDNPDGNGLLKDNSGSIVVPKLDTENLTSISKLTRCPTKIQTLIPCSLPYPDAIINSPEIVPAIKEALDLAFTNPITPPAMMNTP